MRYANLKIRPNARHRGMTAMLAMLYLALFSTLAVGFYGAVSTSMQLSHNENGINNAMMAADIGMNFMQYELYQMDVPHQIAPDQMFTAIYNDLINPTIHPGLIGSTNLNGNTISFDGTTINIPAKVTDRIVADSNGDTFHVSITADQGGGKLHVKVTGYGANSSITRTIQLDYKVGERASAIFDYGVASKGQITMNGNTKIQGAGNPAMGSILSATSNASISPVTMTGGTTVSGDVSMTAPGASLLYSGSPSIAGSTDPSVWASHVHNGVTPPEFPTIDTTVFQQYLQTAAANTTYITTSNPSGTSFTNIWIKAGTNPSFSANTTIKGVVYVETPNQIKIAGNANIQGVIVEQPAGTGDPSSNTITFTGTSNAVTFSGVDQLPNTSQFATLRTLTGAFVLAPDFALTLKGNFGTIGGSIVAGTMALTGNAGGTINGTAIVMQDAAGSAGFSGNSDMIINSQGTNGNPAGIFFGSHYTPQANSYGEPLQ